MKKPINSSVFLEKYKIPHKKSLDYIYKTFNHEYNILEGAWRSAKSTDNILAFCMNVEESDDVLFAAFGSTSSNAKTILFEGDGLGIKYYPDWQERVEMINGKPIKLPQRIFETKFEDNDALVLYPLDNKKPVKYIIAFGGMLENSYKLFRGRSLGMTIATEIDLFHPNTLQEMKARTLSSKHRRNFWDFNPTDPRHFIYKEYVDYLRENYSEQTNYQHRTMEDNPILTDERKALIKKEFPPDSPQYRRFILGERVVAEGLIYNLKDENIFDEFDYNEYVRYVTIADPGENNSATSFILLGLRKGFKGVDVIKEYRHKNAEHKGQAIKMPIDYAEDYCTFINESAILMKKYPSDIISDDDITFVREFERVKHKAHIGMSLSSPNKKNIDERIKNDINLLWLGRLRFHRSCVWTIKAFKEAQYDPKQESKGIYVRYDAPEKGTEIDPIDATEYGIAYFDYELGR